MTDVEQLFWVLVTIYVAVSLVWVRHGMVVFASQVGEPHRLLTVGGSALLRNEYGGLLPINLCPWGSSAVGQAWPLALSPEGVLAAAVTLPDPDAPGAGSGR